MATTLTLVNAPEPGFPASSRRSDEHSSGVSWSAVFGGAFVAAAISLIMLALGAGFGLSVVSPWSNVGISAKAIGVDAIVWLIVTQVVAYALGGYLTGRLRTKWLSIHSDEVYFRDTANGFLVWAVGLVFTVAFLVSSAASMAGDAPSISPSDSAVNTRAYFVDRLFRTDKPDARVVEAPVQAEAGRLLANLTGSSQGDDASYLASLVATQTGLDPAAAANRVSQVTADERQAEDAARRAASHLLLWTFLALLMSAFSASFAATIGGRQRDHVNVV